MTGIARVLAFALVLGGCSPNTDIVARRALVLDAAPETSVPEPDTGVPDVGPGEDARVEDAQVVDGGHDAGPMIGDCTADTCTAVASRGEFCAAARPRTVVIGDSCDEPTGQPVFQYAVCTCEDLVTSSRFEVDSLAAGAPAASASIAVNGLLQLGPETNIDGSVYVAGRYVAVAPPEVSGSIVQTPDDPRCECDPTKWLELRALIEARAIDNDNAVAQLSASDLDGFPAGTTLNLDCGRYYLDRLVGAGPLQIEARGRVALFVGGDVGVNGDLTLTLQNGASAEIYVLGNVRVTGKLELGTADDGNRVMLAVNGTGTIDLAEAAIDGSIYAPRTELVTRGPFENNGWLFVKRANFGNAASVHFEPLGDPAGCVGQ